MQLNNVVKYINVFLASGLCVLEKASSFQDCFFLVLCSGFQQARSIFLVMFHSSLWLEAVLPPSPVLLPCTSPIHPSRPWLPWNCEFLLSRGRVSLAYLLGLLEILLPVLICSRVQGSLPEHSGPNLCVVGPKRGDPGICLLEFHGNLINEGIRLWRRLTMKRWGRNGDLHNCPPRVLSGPYPPLVDLTLWKTRSASLPPLALPRACSGDHTSWLLTPGGRVALFLTETPSLGVMVTSGALRMPTQPVQFHVWMWLWETGIWNNQWIG